MSGIKDRVAIIGMGCTKFGERWDASSADLMVEAAYEAYADAGVEGKDIQAAWLGTVSSFRTGQPLADALKLDYIPISRVENACATATDAFRNACYAVAAGIYDIVLALGVEKLKDSGFSGLAVPEAPGSDVNPPVPPPSQFALAATRYFHEYDIPFEEGKRTLAQIASKNHHNGTMSPKAHFQREVSADQVVNAPMVAWPLGLFDCCGVSDGAAAAIITTPEIAKTFRDDYILVKGIGLSVGAFGIMRNDWDFTHFPESVRGQPVGLSGSGHQRPPPRNRSGDGPRLLHHHRAHHLRRPGLQPSGAGQRRRGSRKFHPRRRPAGEHRRRPQVLRAPHRRQRHTDDLRSLQAATGQGRGAPAPEGRLGPHPQPRRTARFVHLFRGIVRHPRLAATDA